MYLSVMKNRFMLGVLVLSVKLQWHLVVSYGNHRFFFIFWKYFPEPSHGLN